MTKRDSKRGKTILSLTCMRHTEREHPSFVAVRIMSVDDESCLKKNLIAVLARSPQIQRCAYAEKRASISLGLPQ